MRKTLVILFFLVSVSGACQTILIKDEVDVTLNESDTGPNKDHYYSTFSSFGMLFGAPDSTGSEIVPYKSIYFDMGWRSKRQFSGFFALGNEFNFNLKNYNIKQTDEKVFGGFQQHKKEKLVLVNANYTLFTRFNFVKRGDHLGKYLDLGAFGEYAFVTRHITKDKIASGDGYTYSKHYLRGLKYVNRVNYGFTARLGFSYLTLFCNYRFSDLFNNKVFPAYPEIPRFTAGISLDVPVY